MSPEKLEEARKLLDSIHHGVLGMEQAERHLHVVAAELAAAEERGRRRVFADPEALARRFHETYERLAPEHGYETRKESAVPWEKVPEKNRRLMIAVCAALGGVDGESGRRRGVEERDELRALLREEMERQHYVAAPGPESEDVDLCGGCGNAWPCEDADCFVFKARALLAPRDSAPVTENDVAASCFGVEPRDSGKVP